MTKATPSSCSTAGAPFYQESPSLFQQWLQEKRPRALLSLWTTHDVSLKSTLGTTLWCSFYGMPGCTALLGLGLLALKLKTRESGKGTISKAVSLALTLYVGLALSSMLCPAGILRRAFPKTGAFLANWIIEMSCRYVGLVVVYDDPDAMKALLNGSVKENGEKTNKAMMVGVAPHDVLPMACIGCNPRSGGFKALLDSTSMIAGAQNSSEEEVFVNEDSFVKLKLGIQQTGGSAAKAADAKFDCTLRKYQKDPNFEVSDAKHVSMVGLATSIVCKAPFSKHIAHAIDMRPASGEDVRRNLRNGAICVLQPGGVQEVVLNHVDLHPENGPEDDVVYLYLKRRTGFVNYAMQGKAAVVPCFLFGQDKMWDVARLPTHWPVFGAFFRLLSRSIGFTPVMIFGRWKVPVGLPRPHRCGIVWGTPIVAKEGDAVESVHAEYCRQIQQLGHLYGEAFGRPNLRVEIV